MTAHEDRLDARLSAIEVDELHDLLSENSLFQSMSEQQLKELAALVYDIRDLKDGEVLIREGEEADDLYIVRNGELEVLKQEVDDSSTVSHRLAVLSRGMSIGEVSLLDAGPRSATVRSLGPSTVLAISLSELHDMSSTNTSVDVMLKINLAYEMGRRLRNTNETTVRTLREKLDEAETRAEMGKFMSRVLIGTCLYMFALSSIKSLTEIVPDTAAVSVPILIAFAAALYINVRTSIYPPSAYGFTTRNWKPALVEAILFSLPLAGILVLAKAILVEIHPTMIGQPVFDLYHRRDISPLTVILVITFYTLFAPVQEMIARSGMQSSFMLFLTSKRKKWISILLSTLLFSSTHLHVSFWLAVLVFPLGIFWGWLYSRHPTLIGVSASHVGLGVFGLFIIGFPAL